MNRQHTDSDHVHAVKFYENADALCRIAGAFLGEGLEAGQPAIAIATSSHAAIIENCLRQRHLDVDTLKRLGQLVMLDAHETLALFMVDGVPNPEQFQLAVGDFIAQVRRDHGGATVRTYGEMVDVLWREGLEEAGRARAGTGPRGARCRVAGRVWTLRLEHGSVRVAACGRSGREGCVETHGAKDGSRTRWSAKHALLD